MQLTLCESEVKAAAQETINRIAAQTSFQDSLSYATFYFRNAVSSIGILLEFQNAIFSISGEMTS